jgi:hypothetical protein
MIVPAMGDWELVFGPREYEAEEGRGVQVGWGYTMERDGVQHVVHVEVGTALAEADKTQVPDYVRAALRTRGHSAVVPLLGREKPPRRILLTPNGIDELDV